MLWVKLGPPKRCDPPGFSSYGDWEVGPVHPGAHLPPPPPSCAQAAEPHLRGRPASRVCGCPQREKCFHAYLYHRTSRGRGRPGACTGETHVPGVNENQVPLHTAPPALSVPAGSWHLCFPARPISARTFRCRPHKSTFPKITRFCTVPQSPQLLTPQARL